MNKIHQIVRIHQVLILDGNQIPDPLPPLIQYNAECAKQLYPDAQYKMWSGNDLRKFIGENFDHEVLWAFDVLAPYSFKCDLARFCLLYILGGIYIDLGLRLMNHWKIPSTHGIAAFRDVPSISRSWSTMQTGLIWSEPGRPELKQSIAWIVENCRSRYYGENALYPTGPVLFGRAFIAAMVAKGQRSEADDQRIGECRCVTPDSDMLNVSYVSREGTLIAFRTKIVGGDLSHLGLSGVNNYNQLWRSRQAYGEDEMVWSFNDPRIEIEARAKKTTTGIAVSSGTSGRIQYGPFVNLSAGSYFLRLEFSPDTRFSRLFVDIAREYGNKVMSEHDLVYHDVDARASVKFRFTLDRDCTEVEFRTSVFGDFSGEIRRFVVSSAREQTWNFDHPKLRISNVERGETGIVIPAKTKGRVIYGPYTDLEAGKYKITTYFAPGSRCAQVLVDVSSDAGKNIVHEYRRKQIRASECKEITFEFTVLRPLTDVEFRIRVFGDFEGEFRQFVISHVGSA